MYTCIRYTLSVITINIYNTCTCILVIANPYLDGFVCTEIHVHNCIIMVNFVLSFLPRYLLEDQLQGPSSVQAYINALKKGCRCVERGCPSVCIPTFLLSPALPPSFPSSLPPFLTPFLPPFLLSLLYDLSIQCYNSSPFLPTSHASLPPLFLLLFSSLFSSTSSSSTTS